MTGEAVTSRSRSSLILMWRWSAQQHDIIIVLILISVKTGLYLGIWANMAIGLRVEIALHVIFLVVPIVSACPAACGIGKPNQTAAVEEEPCFFFEC